jgi:YebC/PmpR family DNA-binding regulatory protein
MSGHSKWSTIKRKKGAADAKRGKIFTKLIRELSTAASIGGGDLDSNARLRLVVDKAKAANMPKDNIHRAIHKGIGGGDNESFEEFTYEGYGPGGVAVLVETLSDNRNRTVGDVRHVFTKHGGNLGASGCVAYLFDKKGLIAFDRETVDADALLEAALDAGADDIVDGDDSIEVVTTQGELAAVKDALEAHHFVSQSAEISMEPSSTVVLTDQKAEAVLRLMDALEDLDDVQNVYSNFEISDEDVSKFA